MTRMGGRIWTKAVRARWWILGAVSVVAIGIVHGNAVADRTVYTLFDGTTGDYRGPRLIATDSSIAFASVNSTDGGAVGYRVWKVPGDRDPSFDARRSVDASGASSATDRDVRAISPPLPNSRRVGHPCCEARSCRLVGDRLFRRRCRTRCASYDL